jgi:FkbM family methyltransferase
MDIDLQICDGVVVNVPNSLDLITPYVLREQLDWFEDEIKFVRTFLKAGDRVLDIGANYGIYALSMAKIVGPRGHVWAFEPASSTAAHLAQSIARNGFGQITLINAALSNRQGTAQLGLWQNSELNSLRVNSGQQQKTEVVELTTLDHASDKFSWHGIAFVKLDAEGEEGRILEGGARFLSEESPLIMYELKFRNEVHTQLIRQFEQAGYHPYRLIPGLNLLAPFSLKDDDDPFLLNLFCCKDDCAERFSSAGKLTRLNESASLLPAPMDWREYLSQFPYAKMLLGGWEAALRQTPMPGWESYTASLGYYLVSKTFVCPDERYLALARSLRMMLDLCSLHSNLPRLISLARIASEFGQRSIAVDTLGKALSAFHPGVRLYLGEPFLAASVCHESLDPAGRVSDWLFASLCEQIMKLHHFSSYYTGQDTLANLLALQATGFQSAEIDRRVDLIKARYSLP